MKGKKFQKVLKQQRENVLTAIREDPMGVKAKAHEHENTLTQHINRVIPRDDDGITGMNWLLNEMGIRLQDNEYGYSSRVTDLGDMAAENFDQTPNGVLFGEAIQQRFDNSVGGPLRPKVDPSKIDRNALVSAFEANSPLRPYSDEMYERAEEFAPEVDYRRIVGRTRTIPEEDIRLPKFENAVGERTMGRVPEATPPRIMNLGFDQITADFHPVGTGIRATYDFLRNNRNRLEAITNAVDEIAIEYRQFLFLEVVTAIHAKKPSTNVSVGSSGTPTWDKWQEKIVDDLVPYRADILICAVAEKTDYFKMLAGGPGNSGNFSSMIQLIVTGMLPEMNTPMNLNEFPMLSAIGASAELSSILVADFWLVFDRMKSSSLYFQRGAMQDETDRDPENAWVTRWLRTKYRVVVPDEHGIRGATYA